MKKITWLVIMTVAILLTGGVQAQVVISSNTSDTPDASSALDIQSTSGGILIPRMTQAERDLISNPANSLTIYQTDNTPGFYYNAGTKASPRWIRFRSGDIQGVSLANDIEISSSTFTDVPSMPMLTFTAEKTNVLVTLSASGNAYTNSMAIVYLRVWNVTTSSVVGGTNNKMQAYDDMTGTNTPWSTSYTEMLTGLTIGNTYTLKIQGKVDGIKGTYNAAISASSRPSSHHLTLTVIQ